VLIRQLTEDLVFEKYRVPAGTSVYIPLMLLHRDAEVFPEPESFEPERFTPEKVAARPAGAYLPFSGGVRNCIGQQFANYELNILLAQVLRRFKVRSLCNPEDLNLHAEIVLKPGGKMPIEFTRR